MNTNELLQEARQRLNQAADNIIDALDREELSSSEYQKLAHIGGNATANAIIIQGILQHREGN